MQPSSMISCNYLHLVSRCRQRGYTIDEVMPCVVAKHGDTWTIDVDHPAFPRYPRPGFEQPQPAPTVATHGPGTALKSLLAKIGITASPDCKCNQRARYLDEQGCDWAEANVDEIVGWLRESAAERGLPFVDVAGRLLVRRAIANARREEARRGKEAASQAEGGKAAV